MEFDRSLLLCKEVSLSEYFFTMPSSLMRSIFPLKPKVIVTASCGIEPHRLLPYGPLVERALEMVVRPPEKVIVLDRPQVLSHFI